jgi:hypothetical protein
MKKLLSVVAVVGLFASAAYAAPTAAPGGGVRGSVHDMNNLATGVSGIGTINADSQGRVCAFCHTPHHALTDVNFDYAPLWSHNFTSLIPGSNYSSYETATFDGSRSGNFDPLIGPSRLCMSCHDGIIAADQHYGSANSAPQGAMASDSWNGKAIGLGGNFSNDHPIGFDVNTVVAGQYADAGIDPLIVSTKTWQGNTHRPNLKVKQGLYDQAKDGSRLFMTCATCHDVHNNDNMDNAGAGWDSQHADSVHGNYLVYAPQSGSQLCLTCHIK